MSYCKRHRAVNGYLKSTCRILQAASAEDVLVILTTNSVDTLLTDLNMAGNDGLWLLEKAKSLQPNARRLLMSGEEPPNIKSLVASGVIHAFIAKPASVDAIVEAVGDKS